MRLGAQIKAGLIVVAWSIGLLLVLSLVIAWPLLWAWNASIVPLLHTPPMDWERAFAALIVVTILGAWSRGAAAAGSSR